MSEATSYTPISVIQESRAGGTPDPVLITARWGSQFVGLTLPGLIAAEVTGMKLVLVAAQTEPDPAQVNVVVKLAEPGAGLPSQWVSISSTAHLQADVAPGDEVVIDIPYDAALMTGKEWGIVITAAMVSPANLQAAASDIALLVEYATPEPDEPEEHVYTIVRDFKPGDSVLTRVMNGETLVAELKFVIQCEGVA